MANSLETAVARGDGESVLIFAADEARYLTRGLRSVARDHDTQGDGRPEDVARRAREVAERLVELAEVVGRYSGAAEWDMNAAAARVMGAGACSLFVGESDHGPRDTVAPELYLEDASEYAATVCMLIDDVAEPFSDQRTVVGRWLEDAKGGRHG